MIAARAIPVLLAALLAAPTLSSAAAAAELRDPMQPPPLALRKMREAKLAALPKKPAVARPPEKPFRLTSVLIGRGRAIAVIDDQAMTVGESIRGARLVRLTRDSARLVQRGKIINLKLDDGAGDTIRKRTAGDKP